MVAVHHKQTIRDQESESAVAVRRLEGGLEIREGVGLVGLRPLTCNRVIWDFGLSSVFIFIQPAAEKPAAAQ